MIFSILSSNSTHLWSYDTSVIYSHISGLKDFTLLVPKEYYAAAISSSAVIQNPLQVLGVLPSTCQLFLMTSVKTIPSLKRHWKAGVWIVWPVAIFIYLFVGLFRVFFHFHFNGHFQLKVTAPLLHQSFWSALSITSQSISYTSLLTFSWSYSS